ncbi:MAG TPA: CHAT domain-containing protein [Thermoanaerobaculia bacterium]|nr:CHAT domain-containing protein [Thermoanaerobaculia bacterium]
MTEIARATADFERLAASREDSSRLHPLGLLRAAEGKLDEAILLLEAARLADPARADVLADLASAHLSRFGEIGDPEDLFQALTATERALAKEPGSPAALYNRAIAVSWLHLVSEGKVAWEAYLAADAAEPWASVARQNLEHLSAPTIEDRWQEARASLVARSPEPSEAEIAQAVAEQPHRARMLVLQELLPRWARAWRAGDRGEAAARLKLARKLGWALEAETGDAQIRESVAAAEDALSMGEAGRVARHAVGYELLASGLELYYGQRQEEAKAPLLRARHLLESLGDPLWGAPAFFLASSAQFSDPVGSSRMLVRLQERFPADRYPHLSGFCDWVLGTIHSTTGDSERALRFFRDAQSKLHRSAADYGRGPVHVLLGEAHRLLGQEGAASREYLAGIEWAARSGDLHRYHMALYPVAEMLVERGESVVAGAVGEELVANAEASGSAQKLSEAYLQRGRIRTLLGLEQGAEQDFRSARRNTEVMADGAVRDRIAAARSLAEAELLIGQDSRSAVARLNRILDSKLETGYLYHLTRTLSLRGLAYDDLGDVDRARRDLLAAIEEYERLRSASEALSHRRSTFELAQETFDALIALEVKQGSPPALSLALAERSKSRQIADLLGEPGDPRLVDWQEESAFRGVIAAFESPAFRDSGVAFIEYCVLPHQLLTWVVSADGVSLHSEPVPRAELERRVALLRNALTRRASEDQIRTYAASLYDLLLAPIAWAIPPGTPLIVVPDRFLARVPFAVLYDRQARRHLIEDHAVTLSPGIHLHPALRGWEAWRPPAGAEQRMSVLAVAGSAIDRELFPELEALSSAEAEASEVALLYPARSKVLLGLEATVRAFREQAPLYAVVHFAGHALVGADSTDPASLVFAPSTSDGGALGAREIAALDLRRTRLVVLSSCTALDGDRGGRENVTGLAAAFFAAGAETVVAALWNVEDRVSREVMIRFHRAVSNGTSPSNGLRAAQLASLEGADPRLRTPAAWGAFAALGDASCLHQAGSILDRVSDRRPNPIRRTAK